jgi:hypothetical protein
MRHAIAVASALAITSPDIILLSTSIDTAQHKVGLFDTNFLVCSSTLSNVGSGDGSCFHIEM